LNVKTNTINLLFSFNLGNERRTCTFACNEIIKNVQDI